MTNKEIYPIATHARPDGKKNSSAGLFSIIPRNANSDITLLTWKKKKPIITGMILPAIVTTELKK